MKWACSYCFLHRIFSAVFCRCSANRAELFLGKGRCSLSFQAASTTHNSIAITGNAYATSFTGSAAASPNASLQHFVFTISFASAALPTETTPEAIRFITVRRIAVSWITPIFCNKWIFIQIQANILTVTAILTMALFIIKGKGYKEYLESGDQTTVFLFVVKQFLNSEIIGTL